MKNTTLCYIEKDNKYLMLHRTVKKNDGSFGKYIGIGGPIEENESPIDCILREAKEETGFTLNDVRYRGIVTFISDEYETEIMHLFTSTSFSGTQISSDEGELLWVEKSKLYELPMWEGDRIFLDELMKDGTFFHIKLVYEKDRLKEAQKYAL